MPIDKILRFRGEVFYRLMNGDGKVWLMPARNMRVAMNLYQPSGIKGKLLKQFFPLLHHFGFVHKVAGAEKVACSLDGKLYNLPQWKFGIFGVLRNALCTSEDNNPTFFRKGDFGIL